MTCQGLLRSRPRSKNAPPEKCQFPLPHKALLHVLVSSSVIQAKQFLPLPPDLQTLKEAWGGGGIKAWIKSLFPGPGAHGSSLILALGVSNTLATEPEEKGKEAAEVLVGLKGKNERGRGHQGSMCTGTYCSMLAQVPPSGWPGEVQPSSAASPNRACWTWGLHPGLGLDPHCCHYPQVRPVVTIGPRRPHTFRRPLRCVL